MNRNNPKGRAITDRDLIAAVAARNAELDRLPSTMEQAISERNAVLDTQPTNFTFNK